MKRLEVRAAVEGYVDYEIFVDDEDTIDDIYNKAYEEMPTNCFENYYIETDLEEALDNTEEIEEN